MSIEDFTTDWQCNDEVYHIDIPSVDGAFTVHPAWDCLNNVTITGALNSTLILAFNSDEEDSLGVLLTGLFNVIGTAINLVIHDEGSQWFYLRDIRFVNFNKIMIDDASAFVVISDLEALNGNGQPVELATRGYKVELANKIVIDGISRIIANKLDIVDLALCSVSYINWHTSLSTHVPIKGRIESLSANFTTGKADIYLLGQFITKQLDISTAGNIGISGSLESLNGTVTAGNLWIKEGGSLKAAADASNSQNTLHINLRENFRNDRNGTLIGGGFNIKAVGSYSNAGIVDVSVFNLEIEQNTDNDGDIILRDQDGQFKAGGKFGNRGIIQAQKGKLAVIYNPEKEFYMGYLLGHSGVNISPASNTSTQLPYYSSFKFVISSLSTHYIGDDIYHLLKGDFNLDGKEDYLHILNNKYVQFWLTKANGEFEVVSEYLATLSESDSRTVFHFLQKGAVAGEAERVVASTPYAWPGKGILQDINGDGYLDYVEAIAWRNGKQDLGVYLGDEHGYINDKAAFYLPNYLFKDYGNAIYKVGFLKDLNGDGIVDYTQAAKGEGGYENLDVYLGTGKGFVKAGKLPNYLFWLRHSDVLEGGILQDINGDGIVDFSQATCWQSGGCEQGVYLGNKNGYFATTPKFQLPSVMFWVGHGGAHVQAVLRDFNGDGIPDFTVAAH